MRILKQTNSEVHVEFDNVAQFAADRLMTPEQTKYKKARHYKDNKWCG